MTLLEVQDGTDDKIRIMDQINNIGRLPKLDDVVYYSFRLATNLHA